MLNSFPKTRLNLNTCVPKTMFRIQISLDMKRRLYAENSLKYIVSLNQQNNHQIGMIVLSFQCISEKLLRKKLFLL